MQPQKCVLLALSIPLIACGGGEIESVPDSGSDRSDSAEPAATDFMVRAERLSMEGDFRGALAAYREAVAAEPSSAVAHNRLGRTLILLARLSSEHLDEAPGTGSVNIGLDQGVLDEGLESLVRATELDPEHADYHYWLGRALHVRGMGEEAVRSLLSAVELDEEHGPAHKRLGLAYLEDAQVEKALASFVRAEALTPYDPGIPFQVGNLLLEDDLERAAQAFRRAIARDISFAPGYNGLAGVLARLGDREGSREAQAGFKRWQGFDSKLRAALEWARKRPEDLDAQLDAADLLFEKEDWEEARRLFQRGLQLDGKSPYIHLRLGVIHQRLGDYPTSRDHFEETIYLAPNALEPRFELLRICDAMGEAARFDELMQEMNVAAESMSIPDRLLFAEILLALGKMDAAEPHFRWILAAEPTHKSARVGLENALRGPRGEER